MAVTVKEMVGYINEHVEPALAHLLDASELSVDHHYALVMQGYRTLRRFAYIGGRVEEARTELRAELELNTTAAADPVKHKAERLAITMLTDAWRAAPCQVEKRTIRREPRPRPCSCRPQLPLWRG